MSNPKKVTVTYRALPPAVSEAPPPEKKSRYEALSLLVKKGHETLVKWANPYGTGKVFVEYTIVALPKVESRLLEVKEDFITILMTADEDVGVTLFVRIRGPSSFSVVQAC